MRNSSSDRKTVTATPRQLESMIRLSEAFAKMRLSTEVRLQDVENAITLIKSAIQQSATDPRTGLIDMDMIVTGRTTYMRSRVAKIGDVIRDHIKANVGQYRKGVSFDHLMSEIGPIITEDKMTDLELKEALTMLAT